MSLKNKDEVAEAFIETFMRHTRVPVTYGLAQEIFNAVIGQGQAIYNALRAVDLVEARLRLEARAKLGIEVVEAYQPPCSCGEDHRGRN